MQRSFTWLCVVLTVVARAGWGQAASTLEFSENRGQWDARARYAAQVAPGARLFVEDAGFTYALTAGLPGHGAHAAAPTVAPGGALLAHGLRVEFVQPGPAAHLIPEAETAVPGSRHYLRGPDRTRWAAGVRAWQRLRYRQLWPGIDLLLKESPTGQLEYDLLLAAGADPARIGLRYQGATTLHLDPATGSLLAATTAGQLSELRPRAWQTDSLTGLRRAVTCAFVLQGTTVSFKVGKYDRRQPLVIDPVVQFASYTGSAVENWGFAATHDAAGNLYTAGVVFEAGYPATTGAYQTTFKGNIDVAIMKFATSTTGPGARAWATYLGGNGLEFPHSLLVNAKGELLLLGTTSSTDYPTTTTALSRTFKGGPAISPFGAGSPFVLTGGADLVLTRLSASGGGLRASTYLGGTGTDGLLAADAPAPRLRHNYGDAFRGDLALDPQGNVYVASVTSSADFPGLTTAYRGGTSDGLVASLDSSLSQVRWATPLGGSGADAAYSLQREDNGGGLLVTGGTTSPNLAGAAGGYQATAGGGVDGFVTRLAAGGALTQSTYLGTSNYDQAFFGRLGPGGVVVLGQTLALRWPGVDSTRFYVKNGQQFIQHLAPDLKSARYAVVFGSGRNTTDISPTAFDVDCYGRMALAGWGGGLDPNGGTTFNLPTTPNALQRTTDGQDYYLMQLSDGARALDYATFFGTSADDHNDGGTSRFNSQLTLFQAMCACDQSGGQSIPIPPGAYTYAPHNGAARCNNAAFKFDFGAGTSLAGADTLSVCARESPFRLGGSPEGGTWTGAGVTGTLAGGFYFNPSAALVGTQVLTYTSPVGAPGCAGTGTRRVTVLPQPVGSLTSPQLEFCLLPGVPQPAVPLTGTPAGGVFSGTGVVMHANGTAVFDPVLAGDGAHLLSYEVPNGRCPIVATIAMTVKKQPIVDAGPSKKLCIDGGALALVGTPKGGVWTGPGVVTSAFGGYVFSPTLAGVGGPYVLTYTWPGLSPCPPASDTLLIRVLSGGMRASVPADTAFCLANQSFRLRGGLPAGGVWSGRGVTGSLATGFFFTASAQLVGQQALVYTVAAATASQCEASAVRLVQLNKAGGAALSVPEPVVCAKGGSQRLTANPTGGTWTGPGVTGSVGAGFTFTPSPALVGNQTLSYLGPTPPAGLCPVADTLNLQVLALPAVAVEPIPTVNFCLAAPPHGITLTAAPLGGVFSGPGVVGNRFNPAVVGPGHYVITYTWNYPTIRCPIAVTQTVDVVLVPAPRLPADTVLCAGSTAAFQLRAYPAGGVWTGPGVTASGVFTPPAAPGTSVLSYALPGNCESVPYRVTVPGQLGTFAKWTAPACPDNHRAPQYLRFEATGPAADQVRWDFGDGSAPATGAVAEHTYQAGGHYQPLASLPGGAAPNAQCPGQLTLPAVDVQAARLPNIITPNGDGQNDTFAPEAGGCAGGLRIFSRWGQQVFSTAAYHNDWGAAGLPAGLYYYVLGDDQSTRIKGWVEVVR